VPEIRNNATIYRAYGNITFPFYSVTHFRWTTSGKGTGKRKKKYREM
jgi:hypothetical protein